jgi:hypothetical protein
MKWEDIPTDYPENVDDLPMTELGCICAKNAIIGAWEDAADDNDDETEQAHIVDLLAHLRHLCDALGFNFDELDNQAYGYYLNEIGEDRHKEREEKGFCIL